MVPDSPLRNSQNAARHVLLALSFIVCIASACSTTPRDNIDVTKTNPQDLLIVDCLLPPQVRQLGTRLTYLAQRRAIRTSGANCALRGGEYIAYNRADFKSALAVWLPLAEQGDPEAQTYVGEIYEKGLGTRASYELAASWYQRAADQDYSRAKINLGYLYESALGVERDMPRALNLYRQASGFTAAEIEFVSSVEVANRKAARMQNQELQAEVELLRTEINFGRKKLESQKADLIDTENDVLNLKESLEIRKSLSKIESETVVPKNISIQDHKQKHIELDAQRQKKDWDKQQQSDQHNAQHILNEQQILTLQQKIAARETELAMKSTAIEKLQRDLVSKQASVQPALVERSIETKPSGPSINIIDPPVLITRGTNKLTVDRQGTVDLIGKIDSVGTLFSFRINGVEHPINATGLFRVDTSLVEGDNLKLLAVDNKGSSTRLDLSITQPATSKTNLPAPQPREPKPTKSKRLSISDVKFGNYHALIIGNDTYASLSNLKTAGNDAIAIEKILREKYGFRTMILLDANQKTILSALERMRSTLGQQDNLVIYYAGHGELDNKSGRGYWLPIDSDIENKDKWIANSAITAMIDSMTAKHVLVIADSCYSGSLTRSSIARPLSGVSANLRLRWLKAVAQSRVRTVLSSGSNQPVLDGSVSAEHSIFAEQLLDALERNTEVLETYELFFEIQQKVSHAAAQLNVDQTPQYAPIRHAGHQAGEFFFVPVAQTTVGATFSTK